MSRHRDEETEATTFGELRNVVTRALKIAKSSNDRLEQKVKTAARHLLGVVSSEFAIGIEHITRMPPQLKLREGSQRAFDNFVSRFPIIGSEVATELTPLSVEEWAMLHVPDSWWSQGAANGKKASAIYE
jgi:hypothetical protein